MPVLGSGPHPGSFYMPFSLEPCPCVGSGVSLWSAARSPGTRDVARLPLRVLIWHLRAVLGKGPLGPCRPRTGPCWYGVARARCVLLWGSLGVGRAFPSRVSPAFSFLAVSFKK